MCGLPRSSGTTANWPVLCPSRAPSANPPIGIARAKAVPPLYGKRSGNSPARQNWRTSAKTPNQTCKGLDKRGRRADVAVAVWTFIYIRKQTMLLNQYVKGDRPHRVIHTQTENYNPYLLPMRESIPSGLVDSSRRGSFGCWRIIGTGWVGVGRLWQIGAAFPSRNQIPSSRLAKEPRSVTDALQKDTPVENWVLS